MQACYQLHAILNSQDSIDGSSIWCFSDLFEEFHQFPEEFNGGFGLMTQSGIKKPSYYALMFLNEAGEEYYDIPAKGEADIAVFRKADEIHIIASLLDFDESGKQETVNIKIKAAKPESITLSKINSVSANPLALWEKAGSPQTPTPRQITEIKEKSAPDAESADYGYEDGFINIAVSLTSNDIKRLIVRLA
jgi:xylan 1,4-beta-xylosidase